MAQAMAEFGVFNNALQSAHIAAGCTGQHGVAKVTMGMKTVGLFTLPASMQLS